MEHQMTTSAITIRPAHRDDGLPLARLAALDSAYRTPSAPLLVAEVDGGLRAALSLSDHGFMADPFFPSEHILELLRAHASAANPRKRRRRPFQRLRHLSHA